MFNNEKICISPNECAKSIYCLRSLDVAVLIGARQYLAVESDYAFLSARNTAVNYFFARSFESIGCGAENSCLKGFNAGTVTFAAAFGITDCNKKEFERRVRALSILLCSSSSFVFDYCEGEYRYSYISDILNLSGFRIYEHLMSGRMNNNYLYDYNIRNPKRQIKVSDDFRLVLAVKK